VRQKLGIVKIEGEGKFWLLRQRVFYMGTANEMRDARADAGEMEALGIWFFGDADQLQADG